MLDLVQVLKATSCVKEAMNSFSKIACPPSIPCEGQCMGKYLMHTSVTFYCFFGRKQFNFESVQILYFWMNGFGNKLHIE
jgi:hypothetical protein